MKEDQIVTINSRKFDGSVRRSWKCRLIEQDGTKLVFLGKFDHDVTHPDLGIIRRGTISYEYYWLDRWYNVFRFHEPDGEFRNFYCNVNMPPRLSGDILDYVDLDIDVLVWPNSDFIILDEAEFEANAVAYGYPERIKQKAREGLRDITALIASDNLPWS